MRLFSYKMTHDTGFAPNPFGHTLTLATCKPQIRRSKKQGDWIAGFTSKALTGDRVGEERLIYLMQVGKNCTYATTTATLFSRTKYLTSASPALSPKRGITSTDPLCQVHSSQRILSKSPIPITGIRVLMLPVLLIYAEIYQGSTP